MRLRLTTFFLFLLLFSSLKVSAQSSLNMELLAHWSEDSLTTSTSEVRYSDCYGFVWQGMEYAVAGSTEGTHIFVITPENELIPKGFIKGRFSHYSVSHRDYAVYQNYLYAVCDEGVSSLQIIDLSYLPDSVHLAKEDTVKFGRVHNIFIDTNLAHLYSCIHRSTSETATIESAMKVFSITDPLNPMELWAGPDDIPEVHDIYVRNGKAILNCGFDGLRVYNFANDPTNPDYLDSKTFYEDQGYNHQGWLSPSGTTYVFADETNGKRVKKCSFDGTNITIRQLFGTNYQNGSVPHNIMCTDTFAFVAYYNEGFRVFDLRYSPPLEIAHYDTYPKEHFFKMHGNWGLYTLLPSGRILASDRQYGLFVLGFDRNVFGPVKDDEVTVLYPNPLTEGATAIVRLPNDVQHFSWKLFDHAGRTVLTGEISDSNYLLLNEHPATGMYQLRVSYQNYLDETIEEAIKVVVL